MILDAFSNTKIVGSTPLGHSLISFVCDSIWQSFAGHNLLAQEIVMTVGVTGSDLVNWLQSHVEGFADRRDARRYASELLRNGYICHTVNKTSFSEQCYYTIAEICTGEICTMPSALMALLVLEKLHLESSLLQLKRLTLYTY